MDELIYALVIAAVIAVQLVLCRFVKKWWLKIIPTVLALGLCVACWVAYWVDSANWGYLLVFIVLLGPLGADVVAWLGWGIWRLIANTIRKKREMSS